MHIYYINLNRMNEVTGTCHYIEVELKSGKSIKFLVDCGEYQNSSKSFAELYEINGRPHSIPYSELEFVIATHSHNDHIGGFPKLFNYGFDGEMIGTSLTNENGALILRDGLKIHLKELEAVNNKKKNNKFKYQPLITPRTVENTIDRMRGYSYNQEIKMNDNITVTFMSNGHVGGSSMVFIKIEDEGQVRTLLFSGDLSGYKEIPFTKKCNFKKGLKVNYLWTESTYGDRLIPKTDKEKELYKHIKETCVDLNSSLLIPTFSVGRSLSVLYYLKKIFDKYKELEDISIIACSPMLVKSVHLGLAPRNKEFYDDKWDCNEILNWNRVEYIDNYEKLMERINDKKTIFISSSGMLQGGMSQGIADNFIPQKNKKIIMIGYQADGTLGRQLMDGAQKFITTIDSEGKKKKLSVKCKISYIDGMSSHADYIEMIDVYKDFEKKKINKIILTHGQDESKQNLFKELKSKFEYSDICMPKYGEKIKLC